MKNNLLSFCELWIKKSIWIFDRYILIFTAMRLLFVLCSLANHIFLGISSFQTMVCCRGACEQTLWPTAGRIYKLLKNDTNELEKLQRVKEVFFHVQHDAVCNRDPPDAFDDWLNELLDAAYEVEDIIDLFNVEKELEILSKNNNSSNCYLGVFLAYRSCYQRLKRNP